mmetsp:Transcript_5334/g.20776  ORF Transcript_5334/g.20776 Transcript_5334/m.20776 type:complete len:84 (-) Transcript_5334:187-438(-)
MHSNDSGEYLEERSSLIQFAWFKTTRVESLSYSQARHWWSKVGLSKSSCDSGIVTRLVTVANTYDGTRAHNDADGLTTSAPCV